MTPQPKPALETTTLPCDTPKGFAFTIKMALQHDEWDEEILARALEEWGALIAVEMRDRCAAAVRSVDETHESTDVNIGIAIGLAQAERAIRALPLTHGASDGNP